MVDRVESLAPTNLRYLMAQNVAELARLNDALLPDGARCIVQEEDANSSPPVLTGQREFVFTRLSVPAAPALSFIPSSGAMSTPSRNAYRSKSGFLWIAWPQVYLTTLTADTPVDIANVVSYASQDDAGTPNSLLRASWRRTSVSGAPSSGVIFTALDNGLRVVSEAGDDGDIIIQLYAYLQYNP